MSVLSSRDSIILGDIHVSYDIKLTRKEAERVLECPFYFENKTDEESRMYKNSVRVMFLHSKIYDEPNFDVRYSFEDLSLFQKVDGSFFIVDSSCAPHAGHCVIRKEFASDFFENNSVEDVVELITNNNDLQKELRDSWDFMSLFKKRNYSFYAQSFLCYDYEVLFGRIKDFDERFEELYKKVNLSPDFDIIVGHIKKEYLKAKENLDNTKKEEDYDKAWKKWEKKQEEQEIHFKRFDYDSVFIKEKKSKRDENKTGKADEKNKKRSEESIVSDNIKSIISDSIKESYNLVIAPKTSEEVILEEKKRMYEEGGISSFPLKLDYLENQEELIKDMKKCNREDMPIDFSIFLEVVLSLIMGFEVIKLVEAIIDFLIWG